MNLLNRLTVKNLKLNKKRTTVTIIGIILATALICGVATLVSSYLESTKEFIKKTQGDYHYEFINVPIKEAFNIPNNENIESSYNTHTYDYTQVSEDVFVQLVEVSNIEKMGIQIEEGRLPQSEREIAVTENNYSEKIGDKITLNLSDKSIIEYTIVGIVNITDDSLNKQNNSKGKEYFTALAQIKSLDKDAKVNVYVKFKNLNERIDTAAEILGIDKTTLNALETNNRAKTEKNLFENETNKYVISGNIRLIQIESGDYIDSTLEMVFAISAIIMVIVIFTSVFCIKNSFEISITEKVKQYGMLSSLGATSKQIKKNVLYEAFRLGIIGIPLGVLFGTLVIFIVLKIVEKISGSSLSGMNFIFSTNLLVIILSIILSIITIYLSARKASKKASKISPIEAIRSNEDIKINPKKLKTPKFIKGIFGIGGDIAYKNLKRNKKKFRTAIVSIVMCITVFIAMNTFINDIYKAKTATTESKSYTILVDGDDFKFLQTMAKELNLDRYSITRRNFVYNETLEDHKSAEAKQSTDVNLKGAPSVSVISLGNEEYERYIEKFGLKYEDVKDKGILYDSYTETIETEERTRHRVIRIYDYKEGDVITSKLNSPEINVNVDFCIEIAKVTDIEPLGLDQSGTRATIIISDEMMDKIGDMSPLSYSLCIDTENDKVVEEKINDNYMNSGHIRNVSNYADVIREEQATSLTTSIFLYGFVIATALIGITNIFNTITTSMELRQKEFAHLKAIGMTRKEFNKMISLESLFYILKSLIISIPLGLILSYIIHIAFEINLEMPYEFPIIGILISIIVASLLIIAIMRYSLRKINKQNIIETMRRENI